MSAIRSTKTAPAENMTAKPAFRGCRAAVAAAAAIVCGLFAAPLQAEHQTFPVTATLTGTVLENGHMRLVATRTAYVPDSGAESIDMLQSGCEYREKADGETYSDWIEFTALDGTCSVTVEDMLGSPPYTFQARFWALFATAGAHTVYSEPSTEVSLDPTASTEQ